MPKVVAVFEAIPVLSSSSMGRLVGPALSVPLEVVSMGSVARATARVVARHASRLRRDLLMACVAIRSTAWILERLVARTGAAQDLVWITVQSVMTQIATRPKVHVAIATRCVAS